MSQPRVAVPPASLAATAIVVFSSEILLHRNHLDAFRPAEFNPCRGQPSRFAPFTDARTEICVPSLYAATSREAAAFETIFHDIEPEAAFKTVPLQLAEARVLSILRAKRELRLAALFTPDLAAWGIARSDLIDTPKSTYRQTAAWAQAIHAGTPDVDGLVWTSLRCDPDRCIVLFGDRVDESDFVVDERRDVAGDATLLLELRGYGRRAGITIVT